MRRRVGDLLLAPLWLVEELMLELKSGVLKFSGLVRAKGPVNLSAAGCGRKASRSWVGLAFGTWSHYFAHVF